MKIGSQGVVFLWDTYSKPRVQPRAQRPSRAICNGKSVISPKTDFTCQNLFYHVAELWYVLFCPQKLVRPKEVTSYLTAEYFVSTPQVLRTKTYVGSKVKLAITKTKSPYHDIHIKSNIHIGMENGLIQHLKDSMLF